MISIGRLYRGQSRMNAGTKGAEQKAENFALPELLSEVMPHFAAAVSTEGASIQGNRLVEVVKLELERLEHTVDSVSVHASLSFDGKRSALTHQTVIRDADGERVLGWKKSRGGYMDVARALQGYNEKMDRALVLVLRDKDLPDEKPCYLTAILVDRGAGTPSLELKAFGKHELLRNGTGKHLEVVKTASADMVQASMQ